MQAAVLMLHAAQAAIGAIPYIDPIGDDEPPTRVKQQLLDQLDERVEAAVDDERFAKRGAEDWISTTLAMLVGACQGLAELQGVEPRYGPANGAVYHELVKDDEEDLAALDLDFDEYDFEDDEEVDGEDGCENGETGEDEAAKELLEELKEYIDETDSSEDPEVPDETREDIADSLFVTAVMAATAAEWFIDRQEQLDREAARRRRAANRRTAAATSTKRTPAARKKKRT